MARGADFVEVKRQFERVHFEHPLPAQLGNQAVFLLDLAIGGARLLGSTKVLPASAQELRIDWEGETMVLQCEVTRCVLKTMSNEIMYEIGVRITKSTEESNKKVHHLIAAFVLRALDEQRANWNGVPPMGPYVHLEGKGGGYRRCELIDGTWKVTRTKRPEQPLNGFTVSDEVPPRYLNLLCETYERTDDAGRSLTRLLAELSVNKAEGVPTRRYVP